MAVGDKDNYGSGSAITVAVAITRISDCVVMMMLLTQGDCTYEPGHQAAKATLHSRHSSVFSLNCSNTGAAEIVMYKLMIRETHTIVPIITNFSAR